MSGIVSKLKIRTLLITAFILMALLAGVVGGVGLYSLTAINEMGNQIIDDHTLPLADLLDFIEAFEANRALFRSLLITDDAGMQQNFKSQMDEFAAKAAGLIDSLQKKFVETDPVIAQYYAKTNSDLGVFRDMRNVIVNEKLNGDPKKALDMMFGDDFIQAENNLINSVEAVKVQNVEAIKVLEREQENLGNSSTYILVVTIAIVVIISLILGILISSSLVKTLNKIVGSIHEIAEGDFTVNTASDSKNEIGALSNEVNGMVTELRSVIERVVDTSGMVDDAAKQVASSSMSLAQVSTEQASSSQEISASITQIAAQTKTNAESANRATDLSESTKLNAERGNERMAEMLKAMQAINTASVNISNIIKVIDDIAFQTNILALNAAVEAARAGQHGKGFAVVAEEVRTLAARSAKAASETTQMIEDSTREVTNGMQIANETAKSLNDIVDGISKSAELISSISNASIEQSQGISQINIGIDQVSQAIQTTSSVAEESASASSELSTQAADLKELVGHFKITTGGFGAARKAIASRNGGNNRARKMIGGGAVSMAGAGAGGGSFDAGPAAQNGGEGGSGGGQRVPSISLNDTEFSKY